MRKILVFLLSFLFILTVTMGMFSYEVTAFYKGSQAIKVFYPDGIPALTIAKIVKENPTIDKNFTIDYRVQNTPDALIAKVVSGEADIAIVPSNVTAQLYNKNLPYKLAATSGWGSLYVVSTQVLKNYNYLVGKKIFNIGQGLTPDIVFKYILAKNNVNINKDLRIAYLNSATELAPAFIAGRSKIAVMPEPMLTNVLMKKEDAKIYFDLNKEWMKLTGSVNGYPQSSLIIKRDLIEKNRAFVDSFLAKYKESIEWGNKNPDKLGEYAEELSLSMTKTVVEKSISRANMKYVYIKNCYKDYQNYFKVLLDFEPKSIGGKLPDEGIFMEK
jgi:NitT/TauT family transport system substrate-binding protein